MVLFRSQFLYIGQPEWCNSKIVLLVVTACWSNSDTFVLIFLLFKEFNLFFSGRNITPTTILFGFQYCTNAGRIFADTFILLLGNCYDAWQHGGLQLRAADQHQKS